eukprot:7516494-Pyramimonas_sp.AAC.1
MRRGRRRALALVAQLEFPLAAALATEERNVLLAILRLGLQLLAKGLDIRLVAPPAGPAAAVAAAVVAAAAAAIPIA